jgi:four helix bundle protein
VGRDYRNIKAWQLADRLVIGVYKATKDFPKSEMFGLTSQMRRAAVSVAANIVECSARKYQNEYLQFLYISLGSLSELGYYLKLCTEIEYFNKSQEQYLDDLFQQTIKTLRALINFIEKPESKVQGPKSNV